MKIKIDNNIFKKYVIIIIMETVGKIDINQKLWEKDILNSRLEFNIKGKDIDYVVMNTMKRVMTTYIPIYAFTNITINENTSIYNNNYLKLRIQNMPVLGIKSKIDIFVKEKIEEKEEEVVMANMMDDIDLSTTDNFKTKNLEQLTLYLDYENKTESIVTVGTDDCKFYYKEKQIKSPYPTNIMVIKLQPKQKIKLSAISELGIEETSSVYSPVSIVTYKMYNDTEYDMILESRGQLTEKEILHKTIKNIEHMLDYFVSLIPDEKEMVGKLQLNYGDHTIGNIISVGLQKHKNVDFAGYNMPHPLGTEILISYKLNKSDIKTVCTDVVNYYKKIYEIIDSMLTKNIN